LDLVGGTTGRVEASSIESVLVVSAPIFVAESAAAGAGATVSVASSVFSSLVPQETKAALDSNVTKSIAGNTALKGVLSMLIDFNAK
jgi:hypothetical protein